MTNNTSPDNNIQSLSPDGNAASSTESTASTAEGTTPPSERCSCQHEGTACQNECDPSKDNGNKTCRCGCSSTSKNGGICPCMWALIIGLSLSLLWVITRDKAPQQPSSTPPPSANVAVQVGENAHLPSNPYAEDTRYMRSTGHFAQALEILEKRQQDNPSVETAIEILGNIEDTGDSLRLIERARQLKDHYPQDGEITWFLAKGLLFATATFRNDNQYAERYPAWMDEADQLIQELEKSGFQSSEVPGYLPILKAESAFLRGQWDDAEKYCGEGLRLGTTAGETGDLYATLFDIACRRGHIDKANDCLDKAMQVVAEASANSYYGLRMFREEVLLVKDFLLDQHFVEADLDRLWKIHTDLQTAGFVDPTSPDDSEAIELHKALHEYAQKYEAKDYASCLAIIEQFLANKPNHTPRCFFSEAVMSPLRPLYLNMAAGKLCRLMDDKERASQFFEAADKAHPQDALVQKELNEL